MLGGLFGAIKVRFIFYFLQKGRYNCQVTEVFSNIAELPILLNNISMFNPSRKPMLPLFKVYGYIKKVNPYDTFEQE